MNKQRGNFIGLWVSDELFAAIAKKRFERKKKSVSMMLREDMENGYIRDKVRVRKAVKKV